MPQVRDRIRRSARPPRRGRWLTVAVAVVLMVVTLTAPANAAEPDTTAPTTPGPVAASDVTTDSVTLRWDASTDNVGVVGYHVHQMFSDYIELKTTATNSITITGLHPSRTYRFWVDAYDAAGNTSTSQPALRVTMAPGDVVAPSAPGTPTASEITPNSVRLRWAPSTDNVTIASYQVYRIEDGVPIHVANAPWHPMAPVTSATVNGLQSGTPYIFAVGATDDAGNTSALSAPVRVMTASIPAMLCRVRYRITNQWPGGFRAEVRITNITGQPISSWTANWLFPNGQSVRHVWNAALERQHDGYVTVRNASWNSTIAPQGSVEFGFVGARGTQNDAPALFSLNNVGCFRE